MKVKICVPVMGTDKAALMAQAKAAAASRADIVEWRADHYEGLNAAQLPALLQALRQILGGKALLFTIRTKEQGGVLACSQTFYEEAVSAAIRSGCAAYADLEDSTEPERMARLVLLAKEHGVRSIASYHNFSETPETDVLIGKFEQLRDTGADILKTAYMPNCAEDVARLLYATAHFRAQDGERHELITMSMGELGKISRIGGGVFGSAVTFASVCGASAPGQIEIDKLEACLEVLS